MCLDLICFILWVPLPQDVVLWWRPCHGMSWWPCSDGSGDVRPIPVSMRCVLAWRTWRALMSRRCGVMLEGEVLAVVVRQKRLANIYITNDGLRAEVLPRKWGSRSQDRPLAVTTDIPCAQNIRRCISLLMSI